MWATLGLIILILAVTHFAVYLIAYGHGFRECNKRWKLVRGEKPVQNKAIQQTIDELRGQGRKLAPHEFGHEEGQAP